MSLQLALEINPLKQGLKHMYVIHGGNYERALEINPLKQGLKPKRGGYMEIMKSMH